MDVGFIGLGQMGHAIAANLVAAGHEVSLWNRSAGKAEDLVGQGAVLLERPAQAASAAVVFTMLADDAAKFLGLSHQRVHQLANERTDR